MAISENRSVDDVLRIAEEAETGSRVLSGKLGLFVRWFAIIMSIFQLYTGFFGELPGYKQLSIHLFFSMVLCFIYFPKSRRAPSANLTIPDIIFAIVGGAAAIYVFANYNHWVNAAGDAPLYDLAVGGVLILIILEATRRSVSPMLPIITFVFLVYAYLGPYIPGELAHRGFIGSPELSIMFS